jgi:malate permease and related proteins
MLSLFNEFLVKLSPIYLWVLLGFVVGKLLDVKKDDVSLILVFVVLPFITFHGGFTTPVTLQSLSLPLFFFLFCSFITLLFLWIGKKVWPDNTGNLLAFASGYGNYVYFALPAGIILFGNETENPLILAGIGHIIYSCTLGYFVTAKGRFTIKESLKKTLVLPSVYAMIVGLMLNLMKIKPGIMGGIDIAPIYNTIARDMRGVVTILGMMLIGIAIAEIKTFRVDWKFVGLASAAHFIVWPLVVLSFIFLDKSIFHFYPILLLKVMLLMSVIPVGATIVAYASQLGVKPDKAAIAILFTTVFAMFYIPFMISLLIGFL